MAPDHLRAIRGFFYMFQLPIVSDKEDTHGASGEYHSGRLEAVPLYNLKLRRHPLALEEFSSWKIFPGLIFAKANLMKESRYRERNSFHCISLRGILYDR